MTVWPGQPVGTAPVVVVVGATGSGKTSVISSLLAQLESEQPVVIDLGATSHAVPEERPGAWRTATVPRRASCCGEADWEVEVLAPLLRERRGNDAIVLEATDLRRVTDVVSRMQGAVPELRLQAAGLVAVVDARTVSRLRNTRAHHDLWRAADVVVVSRTDCVPPAGVQEVCDAVRGVNDNATLLTAVQGHADTLGVSVMASSSRSDRWVSSAPSQAPIQAVHLRADRHVDPFAFNAWLVQLAARVHGSVRRVKGVAALWGQPHRSTVDVVGTEVAVRPLQHDHLPGPGTQLLVMGSELDGPGIAAGFEACLRDAWEGSHDTHGHACSAHSCC